MGRRTALKDPPVHITNLRPHPYDWATDPDLQLPHPGPYTRQLTASLSALHWTVVLNALGKSENRAVRDAGQTLRGALHP